LTKRNPWSSSFLVSRNLYQGNPPNNSRFGDFVDRIYPIELEIKDITYTDRSTSYLDIHIEVDSEGRLLAKPYNKRDDFIFPIVNFPFICSNIPAAPAINEITKPRIIWWKDIIYIAEYEIKGSDKLLYVFLEKALYEVGPHDNPCSCT
jgi:hypothetical protein